jgi:hypothetical protein
MKKLSSFFLFLSLVYRLTHTYSEKILFKIFYNTVEFSVVIKILHFIFYKNNF